MDRIAISRKRRGTAGTPVEACHPVLTTWETRRCALVEKITHGHFSLYANSQPFATNFKGYV
jgi:hypothetical protein